MEYKNRRKPRLQRSWLSCPIKRKTVNCRSMLSWRLNIEGAVDELWGLRRRAVMALGTVHAVLAGASQWSHSCRVVSMSQGMAVGDGKGELRNE